MVWWTADASLLQSIVQPGADEGFVAIYSRRPVPDERAIRVAVVDRSMLPSPSGTAPGAWVGQIVTLEHGDRSVALDVSKLAPPRTQTPRGDRAAGDRRVPPRTRLGRVFDRLSRPKRIAAIIGLSMLWFVAGWHRALEVSEGDDGDAVQVLAIVIGIYAVIAVMAWVVGATASNDDE